MQVGRWRKCPEGKRALRGAEKSIDIRVLDLGPWF